MTTIAYNHKDMLIAVDGRTTTGRVISTDSAEKWVEKDGEFWFICGSVCDEDAFVSQFKDPDTKKLDHNLDCAAIVARGGESFYCVIDESGRPCVTKLDYNEAIGSGYQWAIAAMDHGKTAAQAVEYAAKRDVGTGGQVHEFSLKKMRFV